MKAFGLRQSDSHWHDELIFALMKRLQAGQ